MYNRNFVFIAAGVVDTGIVDTVDYVQYMHKHEGFFENLGY